MLINLIGRTGAHPMKKARKIFNAIMIPATFAAMMFAAPIALGIITSSEALAQQCSNGQTWCCKRTISGATSCSCATFC